MGRKNSNKKKIKERSSSGRVVKGVIDITRSGMGFVTVEGMEADIMVRPQDFNTALHGDMVKVAVKDTDGRGRRLQGVIREVLNRKRTEFIGNLQMNKGFAFFISESDKPMPDIFIPLYAIGKAKDGDRVVVKLLEWDNEGDKRPVGEVITVLDAENTNDAAMKEILLDGGPYSGYYRGG